jgi:type II secretory pathway component GspD/PulD (secretin)
MKIEVVPVLVVLLAVPALASLAQNAPVPVATPVAEVPAATDPSGNTNLGAVDVGPSIVNFDEVELPEAIRALARQAGLNIQFDPKLWTGPDGKPVPPPAVTVKWRDVTALQALQALLDNWGLQMVRDPETPIVRIANKNPAELEPLEQRVIQLQYSNPTNIFAELTPLLSKRSMVIPDIRTHQLIIMATKKEMPQIESLITKLDAATRQVLIEAKIVETTKDISSAKGVDWTGTLANQHISFGNGTTGNGLTTPNGPAASLNTSAGGSSVTGVSPQITTSSGTTSPGGRLLPGPSALAGNVTGTITSVLGSPAQGGGFSLNTARGISPATAFLNADGVQAVLSFLNTDADTRAINFPRTVALDGIKTELLVVQNIPIFEQTQSTGAPGTAPLATVKPNYQLLVQGVILNQVGVKLEVTPRIAGPTNVILLLHPEISSKDATEASDTLNGLVSTSPIFDRRLIDTEASVPSGYTLVIGGMDQDNVTKNLTKVPFLGDIPGLGNAFRSNSKSHSRDKILIFVTPTIIAASDYQPSNSEFEKTPNDMEAAPTETKPWETSTPYDWTKPNQPVTPVYKP